MNPYCRLPQINSLKKIPNKAKPQSLLPKIHRNYTEQSSDGLADFMRSIEENKRHIKMVSRMRNRNRSVSSVLNPAQITDLLRNNPPKNKPPKRNLPRNNLSRSNLSRNKKIKTEHQQPDHSRINKGVSDDLYSSLQAILEEKLHNRMKTQPQSPKIYSFSIRDVMQEWRRVQAKANSFEEEVSKVEQYTRKNSDSLEKYLIHRKQLLNYDIHP